MKSARIFLLDDYEGARATELFNRVTPERHDSRLMAVIVTVLLAALLIAFVGMAYAETDSSIWHGHTDEQGQSLAFTLRFDGAQALLHIDGPRYDCLLTGKPTASRGSTSTVTAYSVTSNGGRCDALLGGRMEIDTVSPAQPDSRLLKTFTSSGEKRHELGLQRQTKN